MDIIRIMKSRGKGVFIFCFLENQCVQIMLEVVFLFFVVMVVKFVIDVFFRSDNYRVRQVFIEFGDFNLFFVFVDFFDGIRRYCKFFKFLVQFVFEFYCQLMRLFCDDCECFIYIVCIGSQVVYIMCFNIRIQFLYFGFDI